MTTLPQPKPHSTLAAPRRLPRGLIVIIVIECILLAAYAFVSGASALFFGFVSDSCAGYHCDYGLITAGTFVSLIGCLAAGMAGIVMTVSRVRRRRRLPWLVPIVGAVLVFVFFWGGWALVIVGAHLPFDGSGRPA